MKKSLVTLGLAIALAVAVFISPAKADHSWGGYHWARTQNPFTLTVAENLSSVWHPIFSTTISDWSQSSVLDLNSILGTNTVKRCKATAGRIEVCNSKYGNNGWLGLAQIWISGGVHITAGTTKVNDTYFNTPKYNTEAWRNLVMCQEVGHTLGLDHQDEIFDNPNLGTCMDYTSNPSTNQHPNTHDYDELVTIYSHLDTSTTIGSALPSGHGNGYQVNADDPSEWGQPARESKGVAVYERDFGNGQKLVTFVIKTLAE